MFFPPGNIDSPYLSEQDADPVLQGSQDRHPAPIIIFLHCPDAGQIRQELSPFPKSLTAYLPV
jgi:hypothetical protein